MDSQTTRTTPQVDRTFREANNNSPSPSRASSNNETSTSTGTYGSNPTRTKGPPTTIREMKAKIAATRLNQRQVISSSSAPANPNENVGNQRPTATMASLSLASQVEIGDTVKEKAAPTSKALSLESGEVLTKTVVMVPTSMSDEHNNSHGIVNAHTNNQNTVYDEENPQVEPTLRRLQSAEEMDSLDVPYTSALLDNDNPTPTLLSAELVDDDSLRRQIISEAAVAQVVVNDVSAEEKKSNKPRCFLATLVVATVVVLTVGLGVYFGIVRNDTATAPPTTTLVWKQVGDDIDGMAVNQNYNVTGGIGDNWKFGSAVSLSTDGHILAVGWGERRQQYTYRARAMAIDFRFYIANLYNCTGNRCEVIGTIDNTHMDVSSSGYVSLSLSGDGSRVAVAYGKYIYVYATNSSTLVGSNSTLVQSQDNVQAVVSLSSTGDTLAVLEMVNGLVAIYEYVENDDNWQQQGQTIVDQDVEASKLLSLSLSSTGNVVAIGANLIRNSSLCSQAFFEGLDYFGINVRVYRYEATSDNWIQIGLAIDGEKNESLFSEQSIALSSNGEIMAIGSSVRETACTPNTKRMDTGRVRVFRLLDGHSWTPMGRTLRGGTGAGDLFGVSVSLSDDGMTMVIGSSGNNEKGLDSGKTKVYQFHDNDWIQLGPDIDGIGGDNSGTSVAISGDGTTIAVGAPESDIAGSNTGTARIYNLE